jgi:plasmid stabilization system protein ParE
MAYHVELTERAGRNLRSIHVTVDAADSAQARAWFNGLDQAILNLDRRPGSGTPTARI